MLASARLVLFLVCVVCGAWLFSGTEHLRAAAAMTVSIIAFLVLVGVHSRAREAAAHARSLGELNARGSARVKRAWAALPNAREGAPANHPYATDLDVCGTPGSLFRLLDVVSAATGRPALLSWLLSSHPTVEAAELRERQTAVRELASAVSFREELALLAQKGAEVGPEQFDGVLQWAESTEDVARSRGLVWAARLIPIATLALAVLAFFRRVPWTAPGLSIIAGLLVMGRHRATLSRSLTRVFAHASGLRTQRRMLDQVASASFESALLQRLRERTLGGAEALSALERALAAVEGTGSLMHAILNALVLWDVHALAWLDRWRQRYGCRIRDCLAALGDVEALAALGMLAHDNRDWDFPIFDESANRLTASALGHPLIAAATRVPNDVTVGPPRTLLLVTGSNMSGKSTLLRAIGLNVVLAQAGAPVCAARLTMPLLEVRTSIRLADSLDRGVSLFMAELERLKEIVDAARTPKREHLLLYLLDEILHGTNTAERSIAARAVLIHLIQAGAIGAVTTHDLTLAADGALAAASIPVHFTEQVTSADGASAMTFDYLLRPGLATSTNALKLLALVGLGDSEISGTHGAADAADKR